MRDLLVVVGFGDRVFLTGSDFSFPSEEYLVELGKRFARFLFNLELVYTLERFDCTKFSQLAACHAMVEHAKYGQENTTLAVGLACIVADIGVHAVLGVFHSSGGKLYFKLYEPQPDGAGLCLTEFALTRVGTYVFFSL
jgi:hypothetical protein